MKRIRITKHSGEDFENSNLIYFVNTNIQNHTPKTICNVFKLHCTENHFFLFQTSWKDGLSKKIALKYELSCIIGKDDLSFSQKYDLTPWTENKRRSFSKNYTEIWYFLQTLKDGRFKKGRDGTWSFLYYLEERWYFFPENMIFFPWAGSERWLFSRNTWKYDIFCVHVRVLQT